MIEDLSEKMLLWRIFFCGENAVSASLFPADFTLNLHRAHKLTNSLHDFEIEQIVDFT